MFNDPQNEMKTCRFFRRKIGSLDSVLQQIKKTHSRNHLRDLHFKHKEVIRFTFKCIVQSNCKQTSNGCNILMVSVINYIWGTDIRGLMRGMATLPQGNQELLVVRDKGERPQDELGVSKSMECDIWSSVLLCCWLSDRKGIQPVKNWMLVCWWWWFDWRFAELIAPVVTNTSIIHIFSKTG